LSFGCFLRAKQLCSSLAVLCDSVTSDNTQTVSKWGDLLGQRNRVKSKTYALPHYFALEDNLLLGS
jgi:hypothetical protein